MTDALDDLLDAIWRGLVRACHDRRTGWRLPALATVDATGAPRVRTVVLRGADRATASLLIHTDARSAKAGELAREPRTSLMFWDAAGRRQLRAEGEATVHTDDTAFAALTPEQRVVYALDPPPGTPITHPDAMTPADPSAAFRVLRVRVRLLDWLELGTKQRRARFDVESDRASWIAP
jgi:hypothetical protein